MNKRDTAKVIITSGFWRHPASKCIIKDAERNKLPLIVLEDLGELDETKAIGLFGHEGVANHPGNLGKKYISCRIMDAFDQIM